MRAQDPVLLLVALAASSLAAGCRGAETGAAAAGRGAAAGASARVAVAANFAAPAAELVARFASATGREVALSVGSTGQLYAQIRQGAPFDALLAADQARPRRLEEEGLAVPGTRATYAVGRLVLFAPVLDPPVSAAALRATGWRHLALANPRTAPYGAAAVQTLASLGLRTRVEGRLVRGEGVGQTLQFVRSGGAELGFVALSQVKEQPPRSYWLVPDSLHEPIRQDRVLLARAANNPTARAFLDFLSSPTARDVIRSWGYDVPAAGPPAPALDSVRGSP